MSEEKKPFIVYMVMAVKWNWEYLAQYNKIPDVGLQARVQSPEHDAFKLWCKEYHDRTGQYADYVVRTRTWGFFRDLKKAQEAVRINAGDNFDESGYYDGAVIEAVAEGFFQWPVIDESGKKNLRWFYRHVEDFQGRMEKYRACDWNVDRSEIELLVEMPEPRCLKQIVGLTLG